MSDRELVAEMMEWVRGERTHWNTVCNTSDDRSSELQTCAVMDAQEVVKLSAAIVALSALAKPKTAIADALREAADLLEPFSGIGLSNGATRAEVASWLRARADQYKEP